VSRGQGVHVLDDLSPGQLGFHSSLNSAKAPSAAARSLAGDLERRGICLRAGVVEVVLN
jgi:hypothetical protein